MGHVARAGLVSGPRRAEAILCFFGRVLGLFRLTDRYTTQHVRRLSWEERHAHIEGVPRPEQRLMFYVYRHAIFDAYALLERMRVPLRGVLASLRWRARRGTLTEEDLARLTGVLEPVVRGVLWFRSAHARKLVYLWEWGMLSDERFSFSEEFSRLISDALITDFAHAVNLLHQRPLLLDAFFSGDSLQETVHRVARLLVKEITNVKMEGENVSVATA